MKFTKMLALITDILNKDADTQVDVCLTAQMANQIELWTRMYENRSPWVNNKDVLSANLAPAIASELARLVTLEMKSDITGGPAANYLNEQYKKKVIKDIRRYVEYGCAKGGLIIKPYVTKQGLAVQYVQADCFSPCHLTALGELLSVFSRSNSEKARRYIPDWRFTPYRVITSKSITEHLWQRTTTAWGARFRWER